MKGQFLAFESSQALVDAAAERWVRALAARPRGEAYGVALSGGRLAQSFFEAITKRAQELNLDWTEVHFFWADERCVPPIDPESNFRAANATLFQPCGIPAAQIHRIHGEADCAYAAAEAEAELCRIMPLNGSGQPVLNMVFLGVGEDGHTASLFPQESAEWTIDNRVYRDVVAPKPPPKRITLGYQAIMAAQEAWVLASGAAKGPILRAATESTSDLPIRRVTAGRASTLFFHDLTELL